MEIKNYTVNSEFDGLPLNVLVYEPDGEKKGVFQILHGMCEYKERYAEFMRYFAENGYVVVCHDHRGHGDSVREEKDLGYFYEYSAEAIVRDAVQITRDIKQRYAGLPVILYGHSMGSLVARCYLRENDDLIDKIIVCGSPSANPMAGVAIFLEKCIRLFRGAHHRSKTLKFLSTGKGDKNFPGEGKDAWLSRNRENIEEYHANPKSNFTFTCNGFENLFRLIKRTYTKKGYAVKNPTLPVFFVAGGDDPVIGDELQWFKAIEFLRECGYENVSGKLYEGMRHEIHNDVGREKPLSDMLAFCNG